MELRGQNRSLAAAIPGALNGLQHTGITIAQALIGVDVEEPRTRRLLDREIGAAEKSSFHAKWYLCAVTGSKLCTAIDGTGVYDADLVNDLLEARSEDGAPHCERSVSPKAAAAWLSRGWLWFLWSS
jgi:hypothetical protein